MSKHTEHCKITVGSIVGSEAHHYATTIRKSPCGDHNLDEIVKWKLGIVTEHQGQSPGKATGTDSSGDQRP